MHIELPTDLFLYPDIALPEVWRVEQKFDTPALSQETIAQHVREAVSTLVAQNDRLRPGATVAIGVGSRGVDNIVSVVQTAVSELRALGMKPFVVPAMGSHGGATAEGQASVLYDYGITPEAVGAEIRATMEVEEIGRLPGSETGTDSGSESLDAMFAGQPVFWDKIALAADAVILVNRIKAHTDFTGEIESGIAKMSVIGLGKRHGAESVHRHGAFGLRHLMPRIARFVARNTPLVGGIALLENEFGQTAEVHALPAHDIAGEPEKALLRRARQIAPRLPFSEFDILIVDEMGKNISGTGMDTHVVGRPLMPSLSEADWSGPRIRLITCLDLTAPSHGNASGLGIADLVPRRMIEKTDWEATLTNTRTSGEGGVLKSRIPMVLPTSEDCVRAAIGACGQGDPARARLVRIRNTAHTQYLEISGALLEQARANPDLRVAPSSHPLDLCQPVS